MGRNRTNYNNKYNPKNNYEKKEEEIIMEETEKEENQNDSVVSKVMVGSVDIPLDKELNVRSEASKDSEPLTTINSLSNVVILGDLDDYADWYKICTAAGIEGYVLKEFITDIHEATIE